MLSESLTALNVLSGAGFDGGLLMSDTMPTNMPSPIAMLMRSSFVLLFIVLEIAFTGVADVLVQHGLPVQDQASMGIVYRSGKIF